MKIETYITTRSLALAAAVGFALASIAYAGGAFGPEVQPVQATTTAQPSARHEGLIGALKGGAIGCVAGGLLGKLTHHSMLKSCAVGGAVGAVVGGVRAYREQMQKANALAAEARAAGGSAAIETREVQAKGEDGSAQTATALKTMTLNLDPQGVAERSAGTGAVLDHAAALAAQAGQPVHIVVAGSQSENAWVVSRILASDGGASNVQISERIAAAPSLQIAMEQA